MDKIIGYIEENFDRFVNELSDFLRIPSISNDSGDKNEIYRCANWLVEHLDRIGMQNVCVFETNGHPIVYADWLNAGRDKPTILIYGHYDVQPVDPIELWENHPFEPVIKNNKIFARGATDDKGQVMTHIKSIESYLKVKNKLDLNIKLLIEGEEEIGSPNFEVFIKDNKKLLECDYVVISDTAMYKEDLPSICYALRGLAYFQINVTGPNRDLHSGSYGGCLGNPINVLAEIIGKLKDENGRITIDGFYDDVIEISQEERQELAKLPFNKNEFMKELNVNELNGEIGYSPVEQLTARPTLDCNGIWGGYQGKGAKTIIPSKASAKVSVRLVSNQNPDKIAELFTNYVKKICPNTVNVDIEYLHGGYPSITPINTKAIRAAAKALKRAYNVEPVFVREGGSIPIVNLFKKHLNADSVLIGFGLPNENAHSPNENFDLKNYLNGIKSCSFYYNELASL
ncbi:MAG: dipeptidase [Ignavibacteria bacterium]|nr:dipeptidase [Ignavibacteria bacterium]